MLKAVIFDMDGVIIDSEPQHALAAGLLLSQYDIENASEYCRNFIGSTTRHMFETAIKDFSLNVEITALEQSYMDLLIQIINKEGYVPVPGVKNLIKDLYENGIKLAIASSSTQKDIEAAIHALEIAPYFDIIISGATVLNPKPAPDVFLKALNALSISPMESVIIEDSKNGTLAAAAASIPCIGFINPNSGNQDLSKASVLIEDFDGIDYNYIDNFLHRANEEPITIATTKRLIIRELMEDDFPKLYKIYQNSEVTKYIEKMDEDSSTELEKHKAYIKHIYSFYDYGLWGVFTKKENSFIGRCGIQNQIIDGNNEIELSYLIDYNHWGQGYATECLQAILAYAFNILEVPRLVAVIHKQNTPSIKVAQKIGMTFIKELKHKNLDCYMYEIQNVFYKKINK